MNIRKKIIIIHEGRCGSTALADFIGQNNNSIHLGECFEPGVFIGKSFVGSSFQQRRDNKTIKYKEFPEFIRFCLLSHHRFHTLKDGEIDLSLELKVNHIFNFNISFIKFIRDALSNGFLILYLYRENSLRRLISHEKAFKNNVWHLRPNFLKEKLSEKIAINEQKFTLNLKQLYCPYSPNNKVNLNTHLNIVEDHQHFLINITREFEGMYSFSQENVREMSLKFQSIFKNIFEFIPTNDSNLMFTNDKPLDLIIENILDLKSNINPHFSWMID